VAEGTIDVIPEVAEIVEAYLPSGVTILNREPFGGAIRMQIQGQQIDEGKIYQLVVTNEPFRRVIELKLSPYQDA
jgi:hypothetical protein